MSNSSLVTYTGLSLNCNSPRNHAFDRFSVHCFVGQVTAQRGCKVFQNSSCSSCNYVIGYDGGIGLSVYENNRSWCTSSRANDHRAITFEVASDTKSPYAVTQAAYNSLIALMVDICRRYGKTKVLWFSDKDKALNYKPASNEVVLTVHRWFANKACPGNYLYQRQSEIADEVTRRLFMIEKEMIELTLTKDELKDLIREVVKDELKDSIREAVLEVYNELNPFYETIDDVPSYWKDTVQKLLDDEVINGGTNKEICDNDVNIRMETLKAAVLAARIHNT